MRWLRVPRTELREVGGLAWPLILSNITVPLLGLVDTAVLGHLARADYLGAATLGATLFSFLYWGFGFLRMGTTGLTAQARGSDDWHGVSRLLGQGWLMATAIGLILIAVHPPLIRLGLWLLDGSPAVTELAHRYAAIRIASAPAVLANYAILGWALGLGRSRVALGLMVVNNGLNILLDLVFVVGLGMTVEGVALGSVLADYGALATGIGWALFAARRWQLPRRPGGLLAWRQYRQLFQVNAALFVRTLCLLFAIAFFHSQGARLGDTLLAANAVLMQFILITAYGLDGFAHAAESLVGRSIGANDAVAFRRRLGAAALWSAVTATLASLAFGLGGEALVGLLTSLPEVRAVAATYLPWMVAMPLLAAGSYLLDGVFVGATRTRAMRDTMIVALAIYLPCWYATTGLGNHGLWLAFSAFTLARSLGLGLWLAVALRRRSWFTASA
jgi:MATE family multidrug resistance protein